MSGITSLTIRQILVETGEGDLCGVVLSKDKLSILAGFVADLSDGPVTLFKLPSDVKLVPLSELES